MNYPAFRMLLTALYEPNIVLNEIDLYGQAAALFEQSEDWAKEFALKMKKAYAKEFSKEQEISLVLDYTQLFLHPTGAKASPYLSSWTHELGEDVVSRYLQYLETIDIEASSDYMDLPEHAAMVFEVWSMFSNEQKDLQKKYFKLFIAPWAVQFGKRIEENAQTSFYRIFGQFVQAWVESEKKLSC